MNSHLATILSYVRGQITKTETEMLEGQLPGKTAEEIAAAYKASTALRRHLFRINNAIEKIAQADEDVLDDLLDEIENEGVKKK